MPARQLTLYCRTCRARHPREKFSGRILKSGRWHAWADCDDCRTNRTPANIAVDLPNEVWRPVHEFEGIYEISNYTRVRRAADCAQAAKGQLLTPFLNHGYLMVSLTNRDGGRAYFVHRLFVASFVGPIPDDLVINHIDGDKTNNWLGNLEVVTRAENNLHARVTGLADLRGERNGSAKLTEDQVREIRASRESLSEAAARYGVSFQLVGLIRQRKVWRHVV